MKPGEILRQRRRANGLTQTQLALRAGSTQAAISRLERGQLSPSFETLERLLLVMGEVPEVAVRRAEGPHDVRRIASQRRRSPEQRLALALSWNRLAGEVAHAGSRARASATR
jgi:transcriptional regulator with XRE-family HTH domain